MEVRLAELADYAAVTDQGKMVVCGTFDSIGVQSVPMVHPTMAVALRVVASPGEAQIHKLTLRLVDPDGAEVIRPFSADIKFKAIHPTEGAKAQLVVNLPMVEFKKAGSHRFDILIDGRLEKSIDFRVTVNKRPEPSDS